MAGEDWIPWIGRQYNDFKSMLPTFSSPTPPPPPTLPVRPPISLGQAGQNLKTAATGLYDKFQEAAKDPVRTNIRSGMDFYKKFINDHAEQGKKVIGTVGAVTTAPAQAGLSALWDVADPRNSGVTDTGSEKKPISDVLWEAGKATKHGLMDPTADQPELARELGKRMGPTMLSDIYQRNPLGYYGAKFALNNADISNLGGEKLVAGAVGGLAHGAMTLAGMGAKVGHEAAIPMWLAKQQQNIKRFSHGTYQADLEGMLEKGFRPKMGSDVLERYAHAGWVSPEQADVARRQGRPISSKVGGRFGSVEMPVDFPDNMLALNLFEPVPKEDIQDIVDRLHPIKDARKINAIWDKWGKQSQWVVDPKDQISGAVPFQSIQNDPAKKAAVRALERELAEGSVHGINGKGGQSALNHPDMPTASNSRWGATFYHDTVANDAPSLAFDPRVANVTDPTETKPWKPLGVHEGMTMPRDLNAAGNPVGIWTPARDANKVAEMQTHVNDIQSALSDHGIQVDPNSSFGHFLAQSAEEQAKANPSTVHQLAADYLHNQGHYPASAEIDDLWDTKLQAKGDFTDKADEFHQQVAINSTLDVKAKAAAWEALDPEAKMVYKDLYPSEYAKNVAPVATPPVSTATFSAPPNAHTGGRNAPQAATQTPYPWGNIGPKGKAYVKTNFPLLHQKIESGQLKNPYEIWGALSATEQGKIAQEMPNLHAKLSGAPGPIATATAFNLDHFGSFNVDLGEAAKEFKKLTGPERSAYMAAYPENHKKIINSKSWAELHSAPAAEKFDVVGGSGKAHATFHSKSDAEDWINHHAISPDFKVQPHDPSAQKSIGYADHTKLPAKATAGPVAAPTPQAAASVGDVNAPKAGPNETAHVHPDKADVYHFDHGKAIATFDSYDEALAWKNAHPDKANLGAGGHMPNLTKAPGHQDFSTPVAAPGPVTVPDDGWGTIGKTKSGQAWETAHPGVDQAQTEYLGTTVVNDSTMDQGELADLYAGLNGADEKALKTEYPDAWKKFKDAHEAEYGTGPDSGIDPIIDGGYSPGDDDLFRSKIGKVESPEAAELDKLFASAEMKGPIELEAPEVQAHYAAHGTRPGKHEVYNTANDKTVALFDTAEEAKAWMAKQPKGQRHYLDYSEHDPTNTKAKHFQDFSTSESGVKLAEGTPKKKLGPKKTKEEMKAYNKEYKEKAKAKARSLLDPEDVDFLPVEAPKTAQVSTGIPVEHQAEYDKLKATLKDELDKIHFHGLVAQGGYSPADALKELPSYKDNTIVAGPSKWSDRMAKFKSEHPELAEKFAGHTGTEMGSIESHTKDVMAQWETQLSKPELRGISDKFGADVDSVLEDALHLHDIGKADAIKAGSKLDQHKHTIPIMQETLKKRGYSEQQINLVTELFNHDLLGSAVQGLAHGRPEQLGQAMTEKAQKVGMNVQDFVKLQMGVYQADASSYPFVTKFMKKDPSGKWTFKGHKNLKQIESLLETVEK